MNKYQLGLTARAYNEGWREFLDPFLVESFEEPKVAGIVRDGWKARIVRLETGEVCVS